MKQHFGIDAIALGQMNSFPATQVLKCSEICNQGMVYSQAWKCSAQFQSDFSGGEATQQCHISLQAWARLPFEREWMDITR